jgi:hypothetical protein
MKLLKKPLISRVRLYQSTLVAILFAGPVVQSEAQIYTLAPAGRNTSVQIDLAGGITQWTVNSGVNQLNLQTFYYSVGSGPASSIYDLALASAPAIGADSLRAKYADSTISVETFFQVGTASLGQRASTLKDRKSVV